MKIKGVGLPQPATEGLDDATQKEIRNLLARELVETGRFATIEDTGEILFCNDDAVWRKNGDTIINNYVVETLPADVTPHALRHVREVVAALTYKPRSEFGAPEGKIPLQNGLLDLETLELQEIQPEHRILHRHPVEYDPDAEAPEFKEFIDETVPKNERQKLQEFAGYTLLHWGQPLQKLLIIVGPTASGKSTFLKILEALHPEDNVNHASLKKLVDSRFEAATLYGKTINVRSDLPPTEIRNVGLLKELTGEDKINAEYKHRNPFQFRNRSKFIFSCNQAPTISQRDKAALRRIEIIEFPNTVPENQRDPRLAERINEDELPGVLNWALEGYARLQEQGGFTNALSVEATEEALMKWGSPIMRFVARRCRRDPEGLYPKNSFYEDYAAFCAKHGMVAQSKRKVTIELQKIGVSESRPKIYGRRVRCYRGIAPITDEETGDGGGERLGVDRHVFDARDL